MDKIIKDNKKVHGSDESHNPGFAAHSYGFSHLENPFARTCHFLCFRSRKFLSSLTKFRSFAAHSYGFSLAETMVVMIVVAIILAAAAPLISKKMSIDGTKNSLMYSQIYNRRNHDGNTVNINDIITAAGGNQTLNVGKGTNNTTKLTVNGNVIVRGDNGINSMENTAGGFTTKYVLKSDGIYMSRKRGENAAEVTPVFTINENGETNLNSAFPDYDNKKLIKVSGTLLNAPDSGYIFMSNALGGYQITDICGGAVNFNDDNSEVSGDTLNFLTRQIYYNKNEHSITGGIRADGYILVSSLPLLLPVSKGQCFSCSSNNVSVNTSLVPNYTMDVRDIPGDSRFSSNKCYFIPLKKITVPPTPSPAP